jgi:hypothetical protein
VRSAVKSCMLLLRHPALASATFGMPESRSCGGTLPDNDFCSIRTPFGLACRLFAKVRRAPVRDQSSRRSRRTALSECAAPWSSFETATSPHNPPNCRSAPGDTEVRSWPGPSGLAGAACRAFRESDRSVASESCAPTSADNGTLTADPLRTFAFKNVCRDRD